MSTYKDISDFCIGDTIRLSESVVGLVVDTNSLKRQTIELTSVTLAWKMNGKVYERTFSARILRKVVLRLWPAKPRVTTNGQE